ncbi:MAG: tetratricopeptide repeat protein [Candidatus Pacebacteria bacterium]|nr:tetratricopeptide repeat protein [Candidatus Paceibacterota bacterium]
MRSFILLLKRIGLPKIVGTFIALILIIIASVYIYNQPKVLDPNLQSKFDQGKYTEGIPVLEKWLADNPNDVSARETLAAFYLQKASNEPAEKESLKKSMNLLANIIKIDPLRDESFRLLGVAYLMKGLTKPAADNFEKAVRISKNSNLNALAGLSMSHEADKDWETAANGYRKVLTLDPKNEMSNLGLARYYISQSDENMAMNFAWKVANISSNNASLGEAYEILGSAMRLRNQPEVSKTYYEKSISFRPNNVHTLVLLGEASVSVLPLVQKEDRQMALQKIIDLANTTIKLDPNYIHSQTLLYKALLLQNKYAEANAVGKKIVSLLNTDKTLTPAEKSNYKDFYSGEITSVTINSVTKVGTNASTTLPITPKK